MATRYAIYFVPPQESELYRFGASVLGVDCYTGEAVAFPASPSCNWAEAVGEPSKYGFHATLKAPFRLANGATEDDLVAAVHAFARRQPRVDTGMAEVAKIGSFIALVPIRQCEPLNQLAAACVRKFDRFRAPMTEEERNRRLRTPLSDRQVQQLETWGYPYVFEDFRFHMSLTGPSVDADRAAALQWLKNDFAGRPTAQRLMIDRLAISRDDNGRFRVIEVAELAENDAS